MAIIRGNYKLLKEAKKNGKTRLYDLAADPYEKNDLVAAMPELFQQLFERMEQLDESCRLSRDGADYKC